MTLQQYLRSYSNRFIRPLFIKKECEVCGSKDSLELHHVVPFSQLFEECTESLGLDIKDKKEYYTSKEIVNITNWMLGAELKTASVTLCKSCHIEEHNKSGGFVGVNDGFQKWVEEERVKKEIVYQKNVENVLIPYLDSVLGIKIYGVENRNTLIKSIGMRNENNRLIKSHSKLNAHLKSVADGRYKIKRGTSYSKEYYGKVYWVVENN